MLSFSQFVGVGDGCPGDGYRNVAGHGQDLAVRDPTLQQADRGERAQVDRDQCQA